MQTNVMAVLLDISHNRIFANLAIKLTKVANTVPTINNALIVFLVLQF